MGSLLAFDLELGTIFGIDYLTAGGKGGFWHDDVFGVQNMVEGGLENMVAFENCDGE